MDFNTQGAVSGAMGGAGTGASIGGAPGAVIGLGVGALAGGLLAGKPKQYGFSPDDIRQLAAQRSGQIDSFENNLNSMRAQYLAQIPGLNQAAYAQFGGDAAAKFGANGIGVDSGAFASSLARFAIPAQAGMYNTAYSTGIDNARTVNAARGQNTAAEMGAFSSGLSAPVPDPMIAGVANFGGQAGMMALHSHLFPGQAQTPGTPTGVPGNFLDSFSANSVGEGKTSKDGSDWGF